MMIQPDRRLRVHKLKTSESKLLGSSLWTQEFHPLCSRTCMSQSPESPDSHFVDLGGETGRKYINSNSNDNNTSSNNDYNNANRNNNVGTNNNAKKQKSSLAELRVAAIARGGVGSDGALGADGGRTGRRAGRAMTVYVRV